MINKVIIMGRLTADPELRQTPNGIAVCRFSVAVNRQYADKNTGERQADFINVTAWRNTADFVAKYFAKGKMIIVEGSLRNNNYTDGNGVKHYSMEVIADSVNFGESKGSSENNAPAASNKAVAKPNNPPTVDIGDLDDFEVLSDGDVPF